MQVAHVGSQLDTFEDILTATLVFLELQGAALPFLVKASIKYELTATTEVRLLPNS